MRPALKSTLIADQVFPSSFEIETPTPSKLSLCVLKNFAGMSVRSAATIQPFFARTRDPYSIGLNVVSYFFGDRVEVEPGRLDIEEMG